MGLANPVGLAALAAVAVLVALHLRRRRRRVVPVGTLFLWRQIPAAALERERFRSDLLFFLQLALLLALIAGYLRPYVAGPPGPDPSRALVVVLDASASMQAREDGATRFEVARRRAHDLLVVADETMLIEAAARPRVALRWTADHTHALERLEMLDALDTPTNLVAAIELALSEARARAGTRVVVLTDLPPAAVGVPPDALAAVDYVQIGRRDDNLAVASLTVDQPPFHPVREATATVAVRNYGHVAREVVLEARIADVPWVRHAITVPARGTEQVRLVDPPAVGPLVVSLLADDALRVDDRAYGWIATSAPLDVLVVSETPGRVAPFATLLRAIPGSRVDVVARREWEEEQPVARRAAVFDGIVPAGMPAALNALYVEPPPDNPLCAGAGTTAAAAIVDWEAEHPALAGLERLGALRVPTTRQLQLPAWGSAVVQAAAGGRGFPLLVAGEQQGRRLACLGARLPGPSSDDVPLLVLVLSTLRWLEEGRSSVVALRTGVPLALTSQRGTRVATDGLRVAGDPPVLVAERTGLHRLGKQPVVANLFDDQESDIGRDGAGEWPARRSFAPAERPAGRREIGWWLYGAAAGLLAVEWAMWRRRAPA